MTLSCAHLRWPDLFQILARIQGNDLTDKHVDALSCNERCGMLNLYHVVVAKVKVKSAYKPKWLIRPELIPVSVALSN